MYEHTQKTLALSADEIDLLIDLLEKRCDTALSSGEELIVNTLLNKLTGGVSDELF